MNKRFSRSRSDRMLGGVCGGLADFLNIDSIWVRLFFILLVVGDGIGVLIYVILWIILPNSDNPDSSIGVKAGDFSQRVEEMGRDINKAAVNPHPNTVKFIGFGMLALGVFYLLKVLNLPWLQWFNRELLFPIMLIAGGAALLYQALRKNNKE
jgi:phage shock protein C